MTQVRLSMELEVTQETISAYETGKHYPGVKSLLKMVRLFDASSDYILGISNIRMPVKADTLPNDELAALALFRRLDHLQKEKTVAFMQGLIG